MPVCRFLSILAVTAACGAPLRAADAVDFAHDVLPLLKARCAECHTNGKYKGHVSFDTRSEAVKKAIVAGKSGESLLIQRITAKDADERMPPKGPPLTDKEVATFKAWIDAGAPWQDGFSFAKSSYVAPLKPRRPELPPARDEFKHPLDRLVDAYFAKHNASWPAPLDDAAFCRRVWLDLVGLLPPAEELDAFLADRRPDKRQVLALRLLGDRRAYAEHWLSFWNDLFRNDYAGTGYIDGGRKQITAWLYQSLLDNKPYDQFVRELISPTTDAEGFIKGIKWRGVVNASQVPEVQFAQNVGQVFLGINLKCASCHDSFIDNWKLADAYGLAAVIADRPLELHRCDKPTGVIARATFLFPELGTIDPHRPRAERLRQLAGLLTSPDNGRLTRTVVNRLWHRLMGRGIVHPVDSMANEPWSADVLDYLATHLADNGYNLKRTLELIVTSRIYQSQSASVAGDLGASDYVFRGPIAKRMTAEQFIDAVWRITGTAPKRTAFKTGDRLGEPVRASLVVADPLMRSLGRPNREQVVTTRPEELSTLQALDLTNGRMLAETLDRGATNLRRQSSDVEPERFVERLYVAALSRRPTAAEMATAREIVGTPVTGDGLADLLWSVLMLPEFQLIR
jgi:hypothetical protein